MNSPGKNIFFALVIAAIITIFNIVAVTNGSAEHYYSKVELLINQLITNS